MIRRAATAQDGVSNPPLTGFVLAWRTLLGSDGVSETLVMDFEASSAQTSPAVGAGQVIQVSAENIIFTDGSPSTIPILG